VGGFEPRARSRASDRRINVRPPEVIGKVAGTLVEELKLSATGCALWTRAIGMPSVRT
jgi:hypothetical protein